LLQPSGAHTPHISGPQQRQTHGLFYSRHFTGFRRSCNAKSEATVYGKCILLCSMDFLLDRNAERCRFNEMQVDDSDCLIARVTLALTSYQDSDVE
jgi:hypothetical protein